MKKKRKRERTVAQAIGLAIGAAFGVGLAVAAVMFMMQYSDLRLLYDLVANNRSAEIYKSELFLRLKHYLEINDAIVTAAASLVGGLVLGRTGPSRLTLPRTLAAAAASALIFLIITLGFQWAVRLVVQHGKITPDEVDPQFLTMQFTMIGVWLIAGLIGAWTGYVWRTKTEQQGPAGPIAQKPKRSAA